jgi:hypothetical protein
MDYMMCQFYGLEGQATLGWHCCVFLDRWFVRPSPWVHFGCFYIRIHFWDALLIKFVNIVDLELVWNYPRFNFLVFIGCTDSYV